MLVSLIVPFYNESAGVDAFRKALCEVIDRPGQAEQYEIVCIDDGSSDDTLARLCNIARADPRFRVIELSRNFGKESAMTAGLDDARGDACILLDADLQDPPDLIPRLIEAWQQSGADMVLARRSDRRSDSFLKRKTAASFYAIHNRLSNIHLPADVGDCRLLTRPVIEALQRLPERQRFMKGLFAWVGFRTVEIEYRREPRSIGASRFTGWRLWNLALEGITGFSTVPLRIWTYLGGLLATATAAYALYIVVRTLVYGADVPGYASLLVSVLGLGSIQLLSIGILGEYIGRTLMEVKQRPIYLVRSRYEGNPRNQPSPGSVEQPACRR